jgi:MEDS: MEthanogen/methylotroph, DcmR Sensory domain
MAVRSKFNFADAGDAGRFNDIASNRLGTNTDWTAMNASDHFVQFYQSDAFLVNTVAEYVIHGIKAGEACIVVATPEHRKGIRKLVKGFEKDLKIEGHYIELDARETIAQFTNGGLDKPLFHEVIGRIVDEAASRGPVRVFGEMVALLLADGKADQALVLEHMWDEFRETHPLSLFCAYPTGDLARFADDQVLAGICDGHSRVIPDETYTSLASANDRLKAVGFLQQRTRRLESELAWLQSRISAKQRVGQESFEQPVN